MPEHVNVVPMAVCGNPVWDACMQRNGGRPAGLAVVSGWF